MNWHIYNKNEEKETERQEKGWEAGGNGIPGALGGVGSGCLWCLARVLSILSIGDQEVIRDGFCGNS